MTKQELIPADREQSLSDMRGMVKQATAIDETMNFLLDDLEVVTADGVTRKMKRFQIGEMLREKGKDALPFTIAKDPNREEGVKWLSLEITLHNLRTSP